MKMNPKSHQAQPDHRIWRLTSISHRFRIFLCAFVFVWFGCSVLYDYSWAGGRSGLETFPLIDLSDLQRVLVVAPHPDDETLGAAGLIQVALEGGAEVKVVFVTNGDGQALAPLVIERRVKPQAGDYIALGEHRQKEAISALQKLGLGTTDIYFLGYPDRYIQRLWISDWQNDCPIQTAFTRASYSPYPSAYKLEADYCGMSLYMDLYQILTDYQPDVIVLPHPNDDHPDHRATADFSRLALAFIRANNPDYRPLTLGYLVHYSYYPQPRGERVSASLVPPTPLAGTRNPWLRLDLGEEQAMRKSQAVRQYASQLRLMRNFLLSFARANEIYDELSLKEVGPLDLQILQLDEQGPGELTIAEPASENTRQLLLKGADLIGWRIARFGNQLIITADTRGKLVPGLQYRILLKTPDGNTHGYTLKSSEVSSYFSSFRAQIDLLEVGAPPVLGFAAEVSKGAVLDRTGWGFVILSEWLP